MNDEADKQTSPERDLALAEWHQRIFLERNAYKRCRHGTILYGDRCLTCEREASQPPDTETAK
jgi:hypothetical protein